MSDIVNFHNCFTVNDFKKFVRENLTNLFVKKENDYVPFTEEMINNDVLMYNLAYYTYMYNVDVNFDHNVINLPTKGFLEYWSNGMFSSNRYNEENDVKSNIQNIINNKIEDKMAFYMIFNNLLSVTPSNKLYNEIKEIVKDKSVFPSTWINASVDSNTHRLKA
jgi:hypothetical protein